MVRMGLTLGLIVFVTGCVSDLRRDSAQALSATFPDVAVAPDDLVRVVTPFAEPRVVTTSSAEIERSQNVLYVLPSDDNPITMFITDSSNESSSINLALTPKLGGAREVDLAKMTNQVVKKASVTAPASMAKRPSTKMAKSEFETRPCRLCRDQDDEGDGYGGSPW